MDIGGYFGRGWRGVTTYLCMMLDREVFLALTCKKDHLYVNKHPNKWLHSQEYAEKTTKIALATLAGGSPTSVNIMKLLAWGNVKILKKRKK